MKWTKFAYLMLSAVMIAMGIINCNSNDPVKAITYIGIGIWVLLVALLVEG